MHAAPNKVQVRLHHQLVSSEMEPDLCAMHVCALPICSALTLMRTERNGLDIIWGVIIQCDNYTASLNHKTLHSTMISN